MQILKARFRSREEFDEAYAAELPNGGLFVPTTTPLKPGEEVIVEIFCEGLPNKVMIKGEVKSWRPALPRLRVRAGALVAFPPEEVEKKNFLLAALGGEVVPRKRRHARIPVEVPVRYRQLDTIESKPGELAEISVGGALLRSDQAMPPLGADVVLEVLPPGGAVPMSIAGRVTYLTEAGAGVKFLYRDGGGSRRIRELIRRLRSA
ncbi:MAG: PilZ domain-containing protein [Myxococcales bacterium]|nr:PilZ domain-containing protein [Myxococcota bacterium]MDW8281755.1 PilZ domain-containing protein [Myxococcales bacterium]